MTNALRLFDALFLRVKPATAGRPVHERYDEESYQEIRDIVRQTAREMLAKTYSSMGQLFNTIRNLVANGRYVVGEHASERLEERGIMEWQAVDGLEDGELLVERPAAKPNPAVEVQECLPDGTEFKAVWSHLRQSDVAKLVTVHFFDVD